MRKLRLLLLPLAVIYDLITSLRNFFFNVGIFKQYVPKVHTIAVGNLSTGGTGKTPMIEYLIRLHEGKKIGVISRGYGRSTKGYIEVTKDHLASDVGDEPLQIKTKFGDEIVFAVCEKRAIGIQKMTQEYELDLILLDDAYQHRYVKAHSYILLTSYDRPYFEDYVLPAGDLRESRSGAGRADHIVVTKCPNHLSAEERARLTKGIAPEKDQNLHFATISYSMELKGAKIIRLDQVEREHITLVTGIAKPQPILDHLSQYFEVEHLEFGDHHTFASSEIEKIKTHDFIITTEKDFMRLRQFNIPNLYYLEMKMEFIREQKPVFL